MFYKIATKFKSEDYKYILEIAETSIKNNIITRFAYSTREGYSVHNANKKNQDNFVLAPNMCQTFHQHFFAVCDGHGQNGR